jgi:hypothetical protein
VHLKWHLATLHALLLALCSTAQRNYNVPFIACSTVPPVRHTQYIVQHWTMQQDCRQHTWSNGDHQQHVATALTLAYAGWPSVLTEVTDPLAVALLAVTSSTLGPYVTLVPAPS